MILLILCIVLVLAVFLLQILMLNEVDSAKDSLFDAIVCVISMNGLMYLAINYIIEKASSIGWL